MLTRILALLSLPFLFWACASSSSEGGFDLTDITLEGMHDEDDANIPIPGGGLMQLRWRPKSQDDFEQSLWRLKSNGELGEQVVPWGDWATIKSTDGHHFFGRAFGGDWYRIEANGSRTAMDDWKSLAWCKNDAAEWSWFVVHDERDEISRINADGTIRATVPARDYFYSNNNWLTTMVAEKEGDRTWVVRDLALKPLLVDAKLITSSRYEYKDSTEPDSYLGNVPGGGKAFYRFPDDRKPGQTFASAEHIGPPYDKDVPFAWLLRERTGGPASLWGPKLKAPVVEDILELTYGVQQVGDNPTKVYVCKLVGGDEAVVKADGSQLLLLARGSDRSSFEAQALASIEAFERAGLSKRAPWLMGLNDGVELDSDFLAIELYDAAVEMAHGRYLLGSRGNLMQLAVKDENGGVRYLGKGYSAIEPIGVGKPVVLADTDWKTDLVAWKVQDAATGLWLVRCLDLENEIASADEMDSFRAELLPATGRPQFLFQTSRSARIYCKLFDFSIAQSYLGTGFLDDGSFVELSPITKSDEYGPKIVEWMGVQSDGWTQYLNRDMDRVWREGYDLKMRSHTDQYNRTYQVWTWGERDGTWRTNINSEHRSNSAAELSAAMSGLKFAYGEQREIEDQEMIARRQEETERRRKLAEEDYARHGCPDCLGTGWELAGYAKDGLAQKRIYVQAGEWVVKHIGGAWGDKYWVFEPYVCGVCDGKGVGTEAVPYRAPTLNEF